MRLRRGILLGFGVAVMALAPARAAEPIKIGIILPYAPPFRLYAKSLETAMRMALSEHGSKVAGRPITLIFENDENKPPQAIAKAEKLTSGNKVDVLIGGLASNLAIPIAPIATRTRTPLIVVNGGADMLTGKRCSPWVLRVSFSNDQMIRDSGNWIFRQGYKTADVMAPDYVGGRTVITSFKKAYIKAGGKIVGESYAPFRTKDFRPYLAQAKAAKPDTIYAFFPGSMGIQFVIQYNKLGLRQQIPLTGPAWTVSPLIIGKQGMAAVGFKGPINYVPGLDNAANKKFRAAFKKRTGRDPDEVTVNGYDAIQIAVGALKKLGGKTSDKKAIMAAMRRVRYNGPRGPMRIDPRTNNIIQNIYMVEVENV
ncbi:MAG: ABC transporter substrate-binding protein, partial [Pseudomonadota bacterium]